MIRGAKPADARDIALVHVATWRSTYRGIVPDDVLNGLDVEQRTADWQGWLAEDNSLVLVAEEESGICGFCGGGALREPMGGGDAEIYAIYVLAEAQRRGMGGALLRALANGLAQRGFTRPVVWVLTENPARHFYTRLGAKPIGEKAIEIGGRQLLESAYMWDTIGQLVLPGIPENDAR